jgi:hypothetical protein
MRQCKLSMWSSFSNGLRGPTKKSVLSSLGGWFAGDGDNYHKMQMAAAQLGADAVIVQASQPRSQRDYWQYPKPAE